MKKLICIKHAEDCYSLQQAVRFVTINNLFLLGILTLIDA